MIFFRFIESKRNFQKNIRIFNSLFLKMMIKKDSQRENLE